MVVSVYICNVCGKEHDLKIEAMRCHPDIIEEKYKIETYKNKAGKEVEFRAEKL